MSGKYPPGPRGNMLLGSAQAFRQNNLAFLLDIAHQYGDIVHFRLGPYHTYLFNHPDYIRQILVDDAAVFYKDRITAQILHPFLGNSVVVANGDEHKRQRKLTQPALHVKRTEAYAQFMTQYTAEMLNGWQDGQEFEIDQEMLALTMKVASRAFFGDDVQEMVEKAKHAISVINDVMRREIDMALPIPLWLPIEHNRKKREAIKTLDAIMYQLVARRRGAGEDGGDLLSMLLEATDEESTTRLSDHEVRNELITMFMAGHETTAYTLVWVWYLLSQHPEVEARLVEEVDEVLAGRAPAVADLAKLKYVTMVIKEAQRLYPPAWLLTGREPTQDIEIGGYTIKKGSLVYICPFVTHHDARFFPDSARFLPERFAEDREKSISKYVYFPFGMGPRVCMGQAFSMMQATIITAMVAQRYHLSLLPNQRLIPIGHLTLRSRESIRMRVAERESAHREGIAELV